MTINSTLVVLTGLLTWATKQGWGDSARNAAAGWRIKERPRWRAALEPDELADLIAAAATPRPARRQIPAVAAGADLIARARGSRVEVGEPLLATAAGNANPSADSHRPLSAGGKSLTARQEKPSRG